MATAEKRKAALPCWVVALRRRGDRIPAANLLCVEPPTGLLLCTTEYTYPEWYACLFDTDMQRELLPRLRRIRLQRENAGVRLYNGIQVDDGQEWPQSWLCTPTAARAREILLAMLEQEGTGL